MPKAFRCIITSSPHFEMVVDDGKIRPRVDSDEVKKLISPLGITVDLPYKRSDGEIESVVVYAMVPIDQEGGIEIGYVAVALAKLSMMINSYLSGPPKDDRQMTLLAGNDSVN